MRPSTLLMTGDKGAEISTDYGVDWSRIIDIPKGVVYSAVWSGASADVAYAATADGLYQTIDGGRSWQALRHGIPSDRAIELVAVNPLNNAQVVAVETFGAIYRSQDGGSTWQQVGNTQGHRPFALAFDPSHAGVALIGTDNSQLYRTSDAGATWQELDATFNGGGNILTFAGGVRLALPTDPVLPTPSGSTDVYYARETHHTIAGTFLSFYNQYGSLKVFGLPLTEAFEEHGAVVQYFEHTAMMQSGAGVRLLPIGLRLGRFFPPASPVTSTATRFYFPASRYTLSGKFLTFWRTHYGALLLGLPISQPLKEQNGDGTGRTYFVQYFQNMRLEYHPELTGTRYEISIGLLGRAILQQRGWL